MKRIFCPGLAGVALAGLSGCRKGAAVSDTKTSMIDVTITAGSDPARTVYQGDGSTDHTVVWSSTDALGIFACPNEDDRVFGRNVRFTLTSSSGNSTVCSTASSILTVLARRSCTMSPTTPTFPVRRAVTLLTTR